ncbi:MAG: histidine phosphatase family protein [Cyanobacteria bacterium HKST-UBA02]|nr:histidine phosphatase family protein [Cyanobacteria bacterium HKST-UBA02]
MRSIALVKVIAWLSFGRSATPTSNWEPNMQHQEQLLALVRHGQSFANVCTSKPTTEFFYEISGSDTSVGITSLGEYESDAAGDLIGRIFPSADPVSEVRVSEFARIKQTAHRIARRLPYRLGAPIVEPRLNKRSYGIFWNMTYAGVENLHPDQYSLYKNFGALKYRPPEGENYFDLFERVDEFFDEELDQSNGHQLIVGHSAALLAMRRRLDGLSHSEVVRQYNTNCIPNGYVMLYRRLHRNAPWEPLSVVERIRRLES